MLEALTALLLKGKKTKSVNIKTNLHKPIPNSHSIAAIQCKSHCSTGKARRTNKLGNPEGTQKCNYLHASWELGHNAALTW